MTWKPTIGERTVRRDRKMTGPVGVNDDARWPLFAVTDGVRAVYTVGGHYWHEGMPDPRDLIGPAPLNAMTWKPTIGKRAVTRAGEVTDIPLSANRGREYTLVTEMGGERYVYTSGGHYWLDGRIDDRDLVGPAPEDVPAAIPAGPDVAGFGPWQDWIRESIKQTYLVRYPSNGKPQYSYLLATRVRTHGALDLVDGVPDFGSWEADE